MFDEVQGVLAYLLKVMQMNPKPEKVLALAQRIIELKAQLAASEAEWNAFFHDVRVTPAISIRTPRGGSARSRIVSYIDGLEGQATSPAKVADALGLPVASVRTALSVLAKENKLTKHDVGEYSSAATSSESIGEQVAA